MLTKERVLGTSWAYKRRQKDRLEHHARFEVLKVEPDDMLGIYVYSKDKDLDTSELDALNLAKLEELVQRKRIVELTESSVPSDDEDRSHLSWLTIAGAQLYFWGFGLWTFIAGIRGPVQKPWEVWVGAAFMITALLAVAIRRS